MTQTDLHHIAFPNESVEYRAARNALLAEEMELRRQVERVAAQRRALPPGGVVKKSYVFEGAAGAVALRELFAPGNDTLAVYSFMYGPERERPCPGCTHFLDGLNGQMDHIVQRVPFAVVAKSPLPRIQAFARERGWSKLHLYSTAGNDYDADYFGDSSKLPHDVRVAQDFTDGQEWDMPILNVFKKTGDEIRHFWACEILYVPPEPGQDYRHNDLMDPLWNVLDTTPAGRGDFEPKLAYS
jgi:predicted dithiol-disulfide oxidoreductase (DUF899 family)